MAAHWFSRVVWLGIVCNLALAVPTLVAPEQTMMLTLAFRQLDAHDRAAAADRPFEQT